MLMLQFSCAVHLLEHIPKAHLFPLTVLWVSNVLESRVSNTEKKTKEGLVGEDAGSTQTHEISFKSKLRSESVFECVCVVMEDFL